MSNIVSKCLLVVFLSTVFLEADKANAQSILPRNVWELPTACVSTHDVGKFVLGVSNKGYFGNRVVSLYYDCMLGSTHLHGSEYPAGSLIDYVRYGSIWFGGVLGTDTLVTVGFYRDFFESGFHAHPPYSELNPDDLPLEGLKRKSSIRGSLYYDEDAVSEQDIIAVYTDTFVIKKNLDDIHVNVRDFLDYRYHQPLFIEVTQRSYAWSLSYAEDIVMFDLSIKNIGEQSIKNFSIGLNFLVQAGYLPGDQLWQRPRGLGEFCGFVRQFSAESECEFLDTFNLMWMADNDGDPINGVFTEEPLPDSGGVLTKSVRDVLGVSFISRTNEEEVFFNWWSFIFSGGVSSNIGPTMRGNLRDFKTVGNGDPRGDRNKYFLMRNGEVDYETAHAKKITPYNLNWIYPDQTWAADVADGAWGLRNLLSFGVGSIGPGGTFKVTFAMTMGENFHTTPDNLSNLPDDPDAYYANLDFSDLIKNVQWARWIYDNPGIDTDNDGYAGEFRVCVTESVLDADSMWVVAFAETTWYKGDGVPDWRAALPPPAPKMWVTPTFKGINIRFNGQESETTPDIFTKLIDFEGYRIYLARDDRETSYSFIASYDIENYDKYVYNYEKQPFAGWDLLDFPMTLRQIRCAYGAGCDDTLFDVFQYRPSSPYAHRNYPESLFYFVKHEGNSSEFGVTTPITKRFPNTPDPRGLPADSITADFYTADGYLKFFEYEFTIENIIPTVAYYVSVTAMDFGWPKSGLEPLETSITENAQQVYAKIVDPAVGADSLQIVVYPNPYRIDANYRARGFEGLNQDDRWSERVRRIHFANIPPKCTISIFSLDGDLVREIRHDKDPGDPTSRHAEWGLISRNGLRVVSGLYYWVVESDSRTEMGKLVIIL